MILGIGNDLVDIRRIERALIRFGARFTARVFTLEERWRCDARGARPACYAKRYAAKEAAAKALGTGFRDGVFLRDVTVDSQSNGQPVLELTGGAKRRLAQMTPPGYRARLELSLSDEYPLAQAMVVISAERICDAGLD